MEKQTVIEYFGSVQKAIEITKDSLNSANVALVMFDKINDKSNIFF